jgi:hypothetical protein
MVIGAVVIAWKLDLQLPVQSLHITTKVASSHGKMYSMQHHVMKFVGSWQQVCGFLWVPLFPPSFKLTTTI